MIRFYQNHHKTLTNKKKPFNEKDLGPSTKRQEEKAGCVALGEGAARPVPSLLWGRGQS